ncbi:MAG: hypothetical protein IJA62_06030 [Ruminococcus sp.]|nr:hypothetical protein [Ruminococcus sp.]
MLTIAALSADGETLSLPSAVYIELCRDEEVPADSLRIIFPQRIEQELAELCLSYDGEEIFCGVVDEQIFIAYEAEKTEVIARSMAALLLDNEACPHNFVNPCTEVVFERYMAPCGIEGFVGEDVAFQGKFDVVKGSSCWQVAEAFGKKVYGKKPRVRSRKLVFSEPEERALAVFSNLGDGIPFERLEHSRLRCKLISTVRAKTQTAGQYDTAVANPEAIAKGIRRERYLDASDLSGDTLSKAFEAVKSAQQSSEVLTLRCSVQLAPLLGAQARVISSHGEYENYRVSSLRYVMSDGKEYTRVTLCRKES